VQSARRYASSGHCDLQAKKRAPAVSGLIKSDRLTRGDRRPYVTTMVTVHRLWPSSIAQVFFPQAVEGAGVARPEGTLSLLIVQ
jgi:hypothetical protein